MTTIIGEARFVGDKATKETAVGLPSARMVDTQLVNAKSRKGPMFLRMSGPNGNAVMTSKSRNGERCPNGKGLATPEAAGSDSAWTRGATSPAPEAPKSVSCIQAGQSCGATCTSQNCESFSLGACKTSPIFLPSCDFTRYYFQQAPGTVQYR